MASLFYLSGDVNSHSSHWKNAFNNYLIYIYLCLITYIVKFRISIHL